MPGDKKNTVTGYILAGGKSSRMGTDKGLMLLDGKPLIEHIIEQLKPAVGNLVIVSNNPAYAAFGYELITDLVKDIGPAGGIYSALTHSKTDKNFILSCDMPFVTTAAIDFIIQQTSSAQIILPVHKGQMEPMFGLYSKSCLTQWHALIQQGFLKLQEMVCHFNLLKLDVDGNHIFADPLFININTPEDFKKASLNRNL